MTSILQEDGRYGAEAKAVLASPPFAPLAASGAPILLAVETPARVVAATDAALALFGVDAPEALTARIFAGNEPGARRLGELARSLLPGAAPRLERLRFFFGPIAEQVTVLCQRVAGGRGADFRGGDAWRAPQSAAARAPVGAADAAHRRGRDGGGLRARTARSRRRSRRSRPLRSRRRRRRDR